MTKVGFLRFRQNRRNGKRDRRDADPTNIDLIVDDHLLDDPVRVVGDAAVVAHLQFDLAPGDCVAVLLHEQLDRGVELTADGVKAGTGHRYAHADLQDRLLRNRRARDGPATAVAAIPLSNVRRNMVFPPNLRRAGARSTFCQPEREPAQQLMIDHSLAA